MPEISDDEIAKFDPAEVCQHLREDHDGAIVGWSTRHLAAALIERQDRLLAMYRENQAARKASIDAEHRVLCLQIADLKRWPRVFEAALSRAMIRRDQACERGETVYAERYARDVRLLEDFIKAVGQMEMQHG